MGGGGREGGREGGGRRTEEGRKEKEPKGFHSDKFFVLRLRIGNVIRSDF